jgi:hypothetical protein
MRRIHFVAIAFAAAGCLQKAPPEKTLETSPSEPVMPTDHTPLPPIQSAVTSAKPQRLSVLQLRRSYPVVSGKDRAGQDITWRLQDNAIGLDRFARPMGEADFIGATDENYEPSPLYLKFIDDAARSACDQMITADATRATDRVLLRHVNSLDTAQSNPKAVAENVRYLKLRMHGVKVPANDEASIAPLVKLFDQSVKGAAEGKQVAAEHVAEGWRTVCVALLISPEFHTY